MRSLMSGRETHAGDATAGPRGLRDRWWPTVGVVLCLAGVAAVTAIFAGRGGPAESSATAPVLLAADLPEVSRAPRLGRAQP